MSTVVYEYDVFGNLLSEETSGIGFLPREILYEWDGRGQFMVATTNEIGHSDEKSYDSTHGGVIAHISPNGLVTEWEYNEFGTEIKRIDPDGLIEETTHAVCAPQFFVGDCPTYYDTTDFPYVAVVVGSYYVLKQWSTGMREASVFDEFGREIIQKKRMVGNSPFAVYSYVDIQYDEHNRVARRSAPRPSWNSPRFWTSYAYDLHDRVVSVESSADESGSGIVRHEVQHVGLTEFHKAPGDAVTRKEFNSLGQLVSVLDPNGGISSYAYDAAGNRLVSIDANGNQTINSYDLLGNRISLSDPAAGVWVYEYNALGEMVKSTDSSNNVVLYSYDLLGRSIGRVEPEGSSLWVYDTSWIGALASENGPGGFAREYYYNAVGRISEVRTAAGGSMLSHYYEYDSNGRKTNAVHPNGFSIDYIYNDSGHLSAIKNAASGLSYWELDAVDGLGNVVQETLGNGLITSRVYDNARGFIKNIVTGAGVSAGVQELGYEWDLNGNLLSRTDYGQAALTETFSYDDLDRLVSASVPGVSSLAVSYDLVGNILSKSGVGDYVYQGGANAVTEVTGTRPSFYAYDDRGNLVSGGGRTIIWSSFNKPISIGVGSQSSVYAYGTDRSVFRQTRTRLQGSVSNTTTIWYVGQNYELHESGSEQKHVNYVRLDGVTIAMVNNYGQHGASLLYFHHDHLGSIDVVTDDMGDVVERFSYDAFGKRRPLDWSDDNADVYLSQIHDFDLGFGAHDHLDHLALVHMKGRLYDPILGRMLSPDPFTQFPDSTQGYNRYSYVLNNPLTYSDPSGYFAQGLFAAVGTFLATYQTQIGFAAIAYGLATDSSTATNIGFALLAGSRSLTVFDKMLVGFAGGLAGSENFEVALFSGLSVGAFHFVGYEFGSPEPMSRVHIAKTIAHGAVGGATHRVLGGSFTAGFLSAGATESMSPVIESLSSGAAQLGLAAVIGGTASSLGGGKFSNGAVTASFVWAFNHGFPKFLESDHGPHNYNVYSPTCFRFTFGCDVPTVYDMLLHSPAPGISLDGSFVTGDEHPVYILGVHLGDVTVHRFDDIFTIVNITSENHLLHSGFVMRTAQQRLFSVGVRTIGGGTGYQSFANSLFSAPLWRVHDASSFRSARYRRFVNLMSVDP